MTEPVFIRIEEEVLPDNRLIIAGSTNLPPGTHLMFGLDEVGKGGFVGQDKGQVEDGGRFESVAFGPTGGLGGKYELDVTMPVVRLQPDSVKQILGNEGEHLKGPLVHRGGVGVSVRATKSTVVGGAKGVQQQAERQAAERERYAVLYKQAEGLFQEVEAFRQKNAGPAEWAAFLRSFDDKVNGFEESLKDSPLYSAGGMLRGTSLSYLALQANPHLSWYSLQKYQFAVDEYRASMSRAKSYLEPTQGPNFRAPSDGWRTWTDTTGGFSVEAEFGGYGAGKVTLKKKDGSKVQVPLERLSEADQEWIRERGRR